MTYVNLCGAAFPGNREVCPHTLYRYFTLDFERADTPNLTTYYQRLQERPAYRDHVMVSYENLRTR